MPAYGRAHRQLRALMLARYVPGQTICWRCQQPITTLNLALVHLGHDDDNPAAYRGLEHARCSESAGAAKGNKTRVITPRMRRARTRRLRRIW